MKIRKTAKIELAIYVASLFKEVTEMALVYITSLNIHQMKSAVCNIKTNFS